MSAQHSHVPARPLPAGPLPARPVPGADVPRTSSATRHKLLTAVGALIALVVVATTTTGCVPDDVVTSGRSAGGAQDGSADAAGSGSGSDPADVPGIGTPVNDGTFEFTVSSVEPGVARVGSNVIGQDAQGQFVLVHVTVTNTGDKAQWFFSSAQTLVDTEGRQHSADEGAAIYLDDYATAEINPGNSVQGTIVFDVPADAVPASVELHDSAFSGGVSVALG